jgi:hypothetical protein
MPLVPSKFQGIYKPTVFNFCEICGSYLPVVEELLREAAFETKQ